MMMRTVRIHKGRRKRWANRLRPPGKNLQTHFLAHARPTWIVADKSELRIAEIVFEAWVTSVGHTLQRLEHTVFIAEAGVNECERAVAAKSVRLHCQRFGIGTPA